MNSSPWVTASVKSKTELEGKKKKKIKRPYVPLKYNNLRQEIDITIATDVVSWMTEKNFLSYRSRKAWMFSTWEERFIRS